MENKKKMNTWQVATVVLAVLFLLSVFNVFSFSGSTTGVTGNAVAYINDNLLEPGSEAILINSETTNGGIIKATLNIAGQVTETYISPDGKLLFPGAIPLTEEIDLGTQPTVRAPAGVVEVSAADGNSLGPEDAENVVIEFSDFECPFCGLSFDDARGQARFGSDYEAAVPRLKELAEQGKIRLVFRHFPLSFHPDAMPAAIASECAAEQGNFWAYHDKLFENQNALSLNDLKGYALTLGLDTAQFNDCLDTERYKEKVQQDLSDGQSYGVSGTPAFFVNGQLLSGSQPWSEFEPLLNL
tara:strand:+ start:528 stop:1424 length:897 start_codon:yes stop_codon:yes gene_type:complete